MIILLNFENVQVALNGGFIRTSTKIPNYSTQLPHILAKYPGIIVRKLTVIISLTSGR